MTQKIQPHLQAYLERIFPEKQKLTINNLTAINQGWESMIYAFDLVSGPTLNRRREAMVLRLYPGQDAYEKSLREFEGMQRLLEAGYPVPRVYALEREKRLDGHPFILMEWIDGETLWPVLDRSEPQQSAALLTQFTGLFVQLHGLECRQFIPEVERPGYKTPYAHVDGYLGFLRGAIESYPALAIFRPVFEWLQSRRDSVPCKRPAPIHWDYHPGNVILKPDGSMIVIDWTQIQVSDPRFDLAWTLLLTGAYAGEKTRSLILEDYQRISNVEIEQLEFFDVAACVKRIGSVMLSLSLGADQMGMRHDAVGMMRRDFPALKKMYQLMVERTGIRVGQVERLWSEGSMPS